MAKKEQPAPETADRVRVNAYLDPAVVDRMEEARLRLRRAGVRVSASHFVEIALAELVDRRDLVEVMRRHHAAPRRET